MDPPEPEVTNYHERLFEDEEVKKMKEWEAQKLVQKMQDEWWEWERKKKEDHDK